MDWDIWIRPGYLKTALVIILWSLLTLLKWAVFFGAGCAFIKKKLEPKTNLPYQVKSYMHMYICISYICKSVCKWVGVGKIKPNDWPE